MVDGIWEFAGLVGAGLVGAFAQWAVARLQQKPAAVTASAAQTQADAALITAIAEASAALLRPLREELDAARGEITELRGHLRDAVQHMESLEAILRKQGMDVPKRKTPHVLALVAGENGARS